MNTRRRLPVVRIAVGAVVFVVVGIGIFATVRMIQEEPGPARKVVQEIRIIRPPPPPENEPPPPPPPPPEKVDVPEPQDQPDPEPSDEPPPGEQLGVDAAGEGAGDGFGLVGRPGGRDLLASGGSAYAWYAGRVKSEILQQLNDQNGVRNSSYSVTVRLWVRADGSIERVALASSSGNADRDRLIERALNQMRRLEAPPTAIPQPITLRIVARA